MKESLKKLLTAPRRGWLRLLIVALCAAALAGLTRALFLWAGQHGQWIETVYARRIYPPISLLLSRINGFLPFSLAEMLLYALILAVAAQLTVLVIRMARRPQPLYRLTRWLCALLAIASVGYALFYGVWGFNYQRPPLAETLQMPVEKTDAETLAAVCTELIEKANKAAENTLRAPDGSMQLRRSIRETLKETPTVWRTAGEKDPAMVFADYPAPKPIALSGPLCYTQITGIFIPFTEEANVNIAAPVCTLPATAAHEAAHQRGFAREDEANYLAYRVCTESDDPDAVYSGYYLAVVYSMNALIRADRDLWAKACAGYGEAILADIRVNNEFWDAYEGPVAETATKNNDKYLKSNKQTGGVASYGRMVDLLIAEYRQRNP